MDMDLVNFYVVRIYKFVSQEELLHKLYSYRFFSAFELSPSFV